MGLFSRNEDYIKGIEGGKTFTYTSLPTSVDEMIDLPEASLCDPFSVAALTILSLAEYSKNEAEGCEMLDFIKGPQVLSEREKSFLKDRFDGTPNLPMSYFEGAVPQNNYTPEQPYRLTISENKYSRDQFAEGYITLYVKSGGADSPRPITLRNKPSTGQWFLWECAAVVSGIRTAVEADPWA